MRRPTGISILAFLMFLAAACLLLLALLRFVDSAMGASILAKNPGMSAIAGVPVDVFGAVSYGFTGYGLWALKKWGRIITMVLAAIGVVLDLIGLAIAVSHISAMGVGTLYLDVLWLALYIWIMVYLNKPHVKKAFGQVS